MGPLSLLNDLEAGNEAVTALVLDDEARRGIGWIGSSRSSNSTAPAARSTLVLQINIVVQISVSSFSQSANAFAVVSSVGPTDLWG
jgi:hypothetical protein